MENQGGDVGNGGGSVRNVGNQGRNAGNRGENAGNQGGNARIRVIFVSFFIFIASAKIPEQEGSISPSSFFMDSCPTISHMYFAFATKWMSSPSRK